MCVVYNTTVCVCLGTQGPTYPKPTPSGGDTEAGKLTRACGASGAARHSSRTPAQSSSRKREMGRLSRMKSTALSTLTSLETDPTLQPAAGQEGLSAPLRRQMQARAAYKCPMYSPPTRAPGQAASPLPNPISISPPRTPTRAAPALLGGEAGDDRLQQLAARLPALGAHHRQHGRQRAQQRGEANKL